MNLGDTFGSTLLCMNLQERYALAQIHDVHATPNRPFLRFSVAIVLSCAICVLGTAKLLFCSL